MGNFEKASEDVIKLFNEVRYESSIPDWVEFEIRCNNKQKQLYRITKLNDLVETLTDGVNFAIVINEVVFEQLDIPNQKMAINECLAGVRLSDSDALSLVSPDFCTFTGILQKYGDNDVIVLHESVKSLFDAKKQKEDEEKAAGKVKKAGFKKSF